ncbi:unnamed protein product [Gulo gulo]|uniref:60S ribosomal protein L36a-like n=1 Tax=Gulo gulo TaxID=48420 RepID=A0A9X9LW49_GULGU|nr:unnamed protein product [Gulo gulo]
MVNVPQTHWTFRKKCDKHQPHKGTQPKKGKDSLYAQGKQCYEWKKTGHGGQTELISWEKAETTKKIVLRPECVEPNCRSKGTLLLRDVRRLNWEEIRRERAN